MSRSGRLPDFVIVGAQKSGTTSLAHAVGAHPDAWCTAREPHFFDRNLAKGTAWYGEQLRGGADKKVLGEQTAEYLYFADSVAGPMAALIPEARLLVILRSPVDRAYAHYWHNRTRGHEPLDFGDAVAAEPGRLRCDDPLRRARYAYLDRGYYLRQLVTLERWFRRDQIHVVLSDDLRCERAATLATIYRFLSLDYSVLPDAATKDKNRFVEYRSQRLRPLIRRLPGQAQRLAGRLNVRYTSYPPLDPALCADLAARYDEDNAALASWLGRTLTEWGVDR